MPNRILRDWTDSETVDMLTVHAERFFTRLIMKVDDYGRYSANLKMLKSTLFPLKTDVRETDIARWITECEKSGLIVLYSVACKEYLQINNFKQTLRQKHEKYPKPPLVENCEADDTHVHSICIPETKRNETESEEERNSGASAPDPKKIELEKRQKQFYQSLVPFVNEFGKKMIRAFFDYWTEPNKSGTKIRWELEKTWDLKKRLDRWRNNDDKFSKNEKEGTAPPKISVLKTVDTDIEFLLGRFIEGSLDQRLIKPEYYDRLVVRDKITAGRLHTIPGETIEEKKVNGVIEFFQECKKLKNVG